MNKKQQTKSINKLNQWFNQLFNRLSDMIHCFAFSSVIFLIIIKIMRTPNLDRVTVIQAFFEIVFTKL